MKAFLAIILALFLGLSAFSTPQAPDKIIYKRKIYNLACHPLERYFEENPDKRPTNTIISSNLWRGYVATFKIRNKQLFLKDIKIDNGTWCFRWKSVIREVFPNQKKPKIDWFTGLLILKCGKQLNYVYKGSTLKHNHYILIEIYKGDVVKKRRFNKKQYSEYLERQFQAFKMTEEYQKLKDNLQKENRSDESIDSFLRNFIINNETKIFTGE